MERRSKCDTVRKDRIDGEGRELRQLCQLETNRGLFWLNLISKQWDLEDVRRLKSTSLPSSILSCSGTEAKVGYEW